MKKALKIILSTISIIIILMVGVPIALSMLLQINAIQNFTVNQVTKVLSEKTGTTFSISHIDIRFFTNIVVEDAYIEDMQGDSMVYFKKIEVSIDGINFLNGKISLGVADIDGGKVNFRKDADGVMNLTKVLEKLKSQNPSQSSGRFQLTAREININNLYFSMLDTRTVPKPNGIDFKNLDITHFNLKIRDLAIDGGEIGLRFENLAFKEQSGLSIEKFSTAQCRVNSQGIKIDKLKIASGTSTLRFDHLNLGYDSWQAFGDFADDVALDIEIEPSTLSYTTLAYFTRLKSQAPTTITLSGKILGPLSNIKGELTQTGVKNSSLTAQFSIIGLPDIKKTRFKLALTDLNTSSQDIENVYAEITGTPLAPGAVPIFERCGKITVNGTFKGLFTDFMATAKINTQMGTVEAQVNVVTNHGLGAKIKGHLMTEQFELGKTLASTSVGRISIDANVELDIAGKNTSTITRATISSLEAAGYQYRNITIDGLFVGKTYQGSIDINDPNCIVSIKGLFDLDKEIPQYDFAMNLRHANLWALGFNKRDSISRLSASITSNGSGNNLDNIEGELNIINLSYVNHVDSVWASKIKLISERNDTLKTLRLQSEFADAEISGTNSYSEIYNYIGQAITKYIPAFPVIEETLAKNKKPKTVNRQFTRGSYDIKVNVKKANNVASIFVPGLQLATGTILEFRLDPQNDKFSLRLESDYIGTDRQYIYQLKLRSFNSADSILFRMNAKESEFAGLYMPNLVIRGDVRNNMIKFGLQFNNTGDGSMANISTTTTMYRTATGLPQIKVAINPSSLRINKSTWTIPSCWVVIDSTGFEINKFSIESNNQKLSVDGKLGRQRSDKINVDLDSFDAAPLSAFTASLGYQLSGRINGHITGYSILNKMGFDANLKLNKLAINDRPLGDPQVHCEWNQNLQRAEFYVEDSNLKVPIKGYYDLPTKKYYIGIKFPNLSMELLEPLVKGIISDIDGNAAVDLALTSDSNGPSLDGKINIKNLTFKVDYNKAHYSIKGPGPVTVTNTCFSAKSLPITDNLIGTGTVAANLNLINFKNFNYSFGIKFTDILALNTTIADNDVFYGRAFGTGSFNISGNDRKTDMSIVAQTSLYSEFYLPFTNTSTIAEAQFITFVDPNKSTEAEVEPRRFFRQTKGKNSTKRANNMDIKIDLHVLPNTKGRISMVSDYISNNISMKNDIDARGDGHFNIHINPERDIFTMTGMYNISRGKYIFNFVEVLNKEFVINPNSTVTWAGDPSDPEFNLDAVYKVKASMAPIMQTEAIGTSSVMTNLNCTVNLTGQMSEPITRFSITAPAADPEKQTILRNALNTDEVINTQFFSLFLTDAFIPDTGVRSMGGSLANATMADFISNQLSNLASSDKIDVRLGYRPKSEYTSDEFNFGFETDIVADKLTIEMGGIYNTRNNQTYNQLSPFSGDANLTWMLNASRTLKLRGFTRVIERFDEMQGLQESGIGLSFRQDFQTVAELRQRWRDWQLTKKNSKTATKDRLKNPVLIEDLETE